MGSDAPEWLKILRIMRYEAGTPSLRALREQTGLSHTAIGDVLKGEARPTQGTFNRIVHALTDDQATIDQANAAFSESAIASYAPQQSTDLRYLADAINNLADAIREMRSP